MHERTLISVERAAELILHGAARAVDCRSDITDRARGERDHSIAHIPGAVYAHLDRDLADLSVPERGRHPLPSSEAFSDTLSRWGLTPRTDVIAYDDGSGAMAARLWWMLRLVGHERVAVLDGGWAAWKAAGLTTDSVLPMYAPSRYRAQFDQSAIATSAEISSMLARGDGALLDARAAPRFRGEQETIDPVAGHVPGATNRPFSENLGADGRFKSPEILRTEFAAVLGDFAPGDTRLMCGSGVTACHNLLAMEHAGLRGARVYAGSWSEWISDPTRPIAK